MPGHLIDVKEDIKIINQLHLLRVGKGKGNDEMKRSKSVCETG